MLQCIQANIDSDDGLRTQARDLLNGSPWVDILATTAILTSLKSTTVGIRRQRQQLPMTETLGFPLISMKEFSVDVREPRVEEVIGSIALRGELNKQLDEQTTDGFADNLWKVRPKAGTERGQYKQVSISNARSPYTYLCCEYDRIFLSKGTDCNNEFVWISDGAFLFPLHYPDAYVQISKIIEQPRILGRPKTRKTNLHLNPPVLRITNLYSNENTVFRAKSVVTRSNPKVEDFLKDLWKIVPLYPNERPAPSTQIWEPVKIEHACRPAAYLCFGWFSGVMLRTEYQKGCSWGSDGTFLYPFRDDPDHPDREKLEEELSFTL